MRLLATERLVTASAAHPGRVVAIWSIGFLVAAALAATSLQPNLSTQWRFLSTPESKVADNLISLHSRDPYAATEAIVVRSSALTVDVPAFRDQVSKVVSDLNALGADTVKRSTSYLDSRDARLVSPDGHATLVMVQMGGGADEAAESVWKVHDIVDRAAGDSRFTVTITGNATLSRDFTDLSEKDLQTGEVIGVPFALVILLLVFGTVVASLIPVIVAIVAIVIALGVAALIGHTFQLSVFVVNVITMMGLAVGIDYSLFVIERYREEHRNGLTVGDAIARAGSTASRAVLFSGLTVVLAVTGLFLVPTDLFWSLAIGSCLVVAVAVLASLTLLPAALAALGDRIDRLRVPLPRARTPTGPTGGFWYRLAGAVMRQPVISLVVAGGILISATIPYFGIETGLAGVTSMPEDARSRVGFEQLDLEFSGGLISPVLVAVDADVSDSQLKARVEAFVHAAGGAEVETSADGRLTLISLTPHGDSATVDAAEGIRVLRQEAIPASFGPFADRVYVSGWAARQADFTELAARLQAPVFAFVLALSFLLLLIVFRSILVPLKAIAMNLLSVGAAYGLIVLVFQKGVGNELFGFRQVDVIESWLPIFLFSVLFGLSMDYHVFLLSRIRERFDRTDDNRESVSFGLRSTGRIITGAALIMVFVFGGFAAGDLTLFQQMGFGLAVAVLLDATLVRCVMVPATMRLLGRMNWYMPPALKWLPRLDVEISKIGEQRGQARS